MKLYLYVVCGEFTAWVLPFKREQTFVDFNEALASLEQPQADEEPIDADAEFPVLHGIRSLEGVTSALFGGEDGRSIVITRRGAEVSWPAVLKDVPAIFSECLGADDVSLKIMIAA